MIHFSNISVSFRLERKNLLDAKHSSLLGDEQTKFYGIAPAEAMLLEGDEKSSQGPMLQNFLW
jgi:hypothetical protein